MRFSSPVLLFAFCLGLANAQRPTAEQPEHKPAVPSLLEVKRVYVAELTGGTEAGALRELIISSLTGSKLFVVTDNPDRADAVLKGAADDRTFTDTFDSDDSINLHANAGSSTGGSNGSGSRSAGYGGLSVGEHEASHIKERKHEAYAAVRLCNEDGDVLWSTTQESLGAKFRGASADVAAKVARQLTLDFERARRAALSVQPTSKP